MNKRIFAALALIATVAFSAGTTFAAPAPLPQFGGGTGTNATSSAGQVPISTGSSTYTPGFIGSTSGITVTPASGTITIGLNINGGTQSCTNQQVVTSLSSTGIITCGIYVKTLAGITTSTISILGTGSQITVTTTTNSITLSLPQNIATSSSPTFAAITLNGQVVATGIQALSTSTQSNIENFDNILYVPQNYTTSTYGDFGQYLLNWYNQQQSIASGTLIMIPPGLKIASSSWTTNAIFANDGERIQIRCVGGGATELDFGGSGHAMEINTGSGKAGGTHMTGYGIDGCFIKGPSGTGTSTGIFVGGTNGAEGVQLTNNKVTGYGVGVETNANTWEFLMQGNFISGNATNTVIDTPNNSGERYDFIANGFFDPSVTNATSSVYFTGSGTASVYFAGNSIDDAGLQVANGNLNFTSIGNHFENPGHGSYGGYPFVTVDSSSNGTNFVDFGSTFMNDASATAESPAGGLAYVLCGANCNFWGATVDRNGSATTTTYFVFNTPSTANAKIMVCNTLLVASPVTRLTPGLTNLTTNNGCMYSIGNNYMAGMDFQNGNNTWVFYNGGVIVERQACNEGGSGAVCSWGFGTNTTPSSTIDLHGTLGLSVQVAGASTTIIGQEGATAQNGNFTYEYSGASTSSIWTLPPATSTIGRIYAITSIGTGKSQLTPTSTDFISIGNVTTTAYSVTAGSNIIVQSNGTNWIVLARTPQRYLTPTVSGALTAGTCDSATTTVDSWLTTGTANSASFGWAPTSDPGAVAVHVTLTPSLMTLYECGLGVLTPTSTTYTVTIQ